MSGVRIVIDTNLWISFLIRDRLSTKSDSFLIDEKFTILFSDELLQEFIEVAKRPKFRKYFPVNVIEALTAYLKEHAEFVSINSQIQVCRDVKDNFLLDLCVDGKADFLLTGDKDLLVLGKVKNTRIVRLADFINEMK